MQWYPYIHIPYSVDQQPIVKIEGFYFMYSGLKLSPSSTTLKLTRILAYYSTSPFETLQVKTKF